MKIFLIIFGVLLVAFVLGSIYCCMAIGENESKNEELLEKLLEKTNVETKKEL